MAPGVEVVQLLGPSPAPRPTSPLRPRTAARPVVVAARPWAQQGLLPSVGSRFVARVLQEYEHQPLPGSAALVWGRCEVRQLPQQAKQVPRRPLVARRVVGVASHASNASNGWSVWSASARCGR